MSGDLPRPFLRSVASLTVRSRVLMADVAFVVAAAVNAIPILVFEHLPLTDGPSHVYNASLLARYAIDPTGFATTLLRLNPSLPPNLAAHGILALLMALHVPPIAAERLLLAGYAVFLPVSLKYAMRGVSERTGGIEYLALPVVFNSHVHWGFLNFLLGLIGFLVALGLWLRWRRRPHGVRPTLALTAVLTAVYFCHPVPLIEFWIAALVLLAFDVSRRLDSAASDARLLGIASVAPVVLLLHSAVTGPPALVPEPPLAWPSIRYAGVSLFTLAPLATYTGAERLVAGCVALIAAGGAVAVWTRAQNAHARALIGASVAAALVVFAAPSQAIGGTLITARLVYFPLFLVLVAMTMVSWPGAWSMGVIVAAGALSVTVTASRWPIYERYDSRMREFLQLADRLPPPDHVYFAALGDSTTLTLDDRATPNVPASAWGYVAARHANWLESDYEPLLSYFPLVYRASLPRPAALPRACGHVVLPAMRQSAGTVGRAPIVIWMRANRAEQASCPQSAPGIWKTARGSDGVLVAWWPAPSCGSPRSEGTGLAR